MGYLPDGMNMNNGVMEKRRPPQVFIHVGLQWRVGTSLWQKVKECISLLRNRLNVYLFFLKISNNNKKKKLWLYYNSLTKSSLAVDLLNQSFSLPALDFLWVINSRSWVLHSSFISYLYDNKKYHLTDILVQIVTNFSG